MASARQCCLVPRWRGHERRAAPAVTVVGASLSDAVEANVRPGDAVHVMLGHSRWTAAARELARQQWGTDAGLTLIMTSLGALGALFFRGGMVRRVVTAYSGNSFPSYAPNPIFAQAYQSGEVAVEHWSILTLGQRLEAGRPRPPRAGHRLGGRIRHGRQSGVHRGRHPLRPGGPGRPPGPRCRLLPCRPVRCPGKPGHLRTDARRHVGGVGRPPGRGGHRGEDRGRPRGARAPGANPCPPGAGRGRGPVRRPPRWLLRAGPPGGRVRRGHPLLGRRRGGGPRRFRCLGAPPSARSPGPGPLPRAARGRPPGPPAQPGRPRVVASPMPRPTRCRRTIPSAPGRWRPAWAPARSGPWCPPTGPMPCWPAPGWPTWRHGSPSAGPEPRASRCASPPSSDCGTTRRRRPIPTSSTTGSSRAPPSSRMPPPSSACWSEGPGPSPSGASAGPRWTRLATSTRHSSRPGDFWSVRVGPTTWSAGPPPVW